MGALPTKYDRYLKGKDKVLITIQYSGKSSQSCSSGTSRIFYQEAKRFLKSQDFGRYVTVKGLPDKGETGNFEVEVHHTWKTKNGSEQLKTLVHSKKKHKKRGDWFLTTEEERLRIVQRMDAVLLGSEKVKRKELVLPSSDLKKLSSDEIRV